jgi:hypothetical protein
VGTTEGKPFLVGLPFSFERRCRFIQLMQVIKQASIAARQGNGLSNPGARMLTGYCKGE